MKKLYKTFYASDYDTIGGMFFGYLFLFMCIPFWLPYYYVAKLYRKINEKHGVYSHSVHDTGIFFGVIFAIASAIIFPILVFGDALETPLSWYYLLIAPILWFIITPAIHLIFNISTKYDKKAYKECKKFEKYKRKVEKEKSERIAKKIPKIKKRTKVSEDWEGFSTDIFYNNLDEFKNMNKIKNQNYAK